MSRGWCASPGPRQRRHRSGRAPVVTPARVRRHRAPSDGGDRWRPEAPSARRAGCTRVLPPTRHLCTRASTPADGERRTRRPPVTCGYAPIPHVRTPCAAVHVVPCPSFPVGFRVLHLLPPLPFALLASPCRLPSLVARLALLRRPVEHRRARAPASVRLTACLIARLPLSALCSLAVIPPSAG